MPIMIATSDNARHVIPIAGWTHTDILGVAFTYEASGFNVTTTAA